MTLRVPLRAEVGIGHGLDVRQVEGLPAAACDRPESPWRAR